MDFRRFVAVAGLAAFLAAPAVAWSCKAAGENTHVGELMAVNAEINSFTIRDAESQSPITFITDDEGHKLRAIDVAYYESEKWPEYLCRHLEGRWKRNFLL